jgi:hypothetical protein
VHAVVEETEQTIMGAQRTQKVVHAIYKTPGKFLGFVNAVETPASMLNPASISAPFLIENNSVSVKADMPKGVAEKAPELAHTLTVFIEPNHC